MNTVFFGTPEFAVPVLKSLLDAKYKIVGVFSGQGPVSFVAQENKIPLFQPGSLKDDEVFEDFKNLKPDLCVVAAYGKIIPKKFLDIPRYGFVNVHPSILPKHRGPSPVQTAILDGNRESGVSIMVIDEEIDHGPILAQETYNLLPTTNNVRASKDLFELGAKLLIETLPKYINGEIKAIEQDHAQATFTKRFAREDGKINWDNLGEKIYNQVRALNPEPGTWTMWSSKVINIFDVTTSDVVNPQIEANELKETGIVKKMADGDIAVTTKKCYLILKQIQLENGKKMDARSFVNGHPDFLGSRLN